MLIATMVVYFVMVLGIGVLAERRTKGHSDFMLAGRRTGPFVAAIGAAASSSSAWSLLGVSGAAYSWGLSALWLFPSCVGGIALNWFLMAGPLRDAGHVSGAASVPDLLTGGARARGVRVMSALIILISLGAYIASQYQGAGKTFHTVFGVSTEAAIIVGATLVFAYTLLGGFLAVSLTDTVQGLVMSVCAVVLPIAALQHVGGLSGLQSGLHSVEVPGYMTAYGPRPAIVGIGFVAGLLGIGLGYTGQPHVVKYFLAMDRAPQTVSRGRWFSLAWAIITYGGMILLGLCGRVMFPELDDKETVLLHAARELLPPAVAGVMLSAVLAAIMSTADSQLLVAAGTVTKDLGLGGGGSDRRRLWTIRATLFGLSVAAALAALYGSEEIYSRVLFGWAAMGAAFGPTLIVRVVLRRDLDARWTFALVTGGALLAAGAHALYTPILGTADFRSVFVHVVPFSSMLVMALLTSRPNIKG